MDPVETLRAAAAGMRRQEPGYLGREFWAALAGLLEAHAGHAEQSGVWLPHALSPGPLAVARAYLGGEAE